MPAQKQAKSSKLQSVAPLKPRAVKIALATRGWTQARLAKEIGKSLACVNLAINHNSFPAVTTSIRKKLAL